MLTCTDAEKASLDTAEAGLEEAATAVEDSYNDHRGKGILQMCQRNALKVPAMAVSLVFAGHPL